MSDLVVPEELIRKRLRGRYGLERLKKIPHGPVPAIFKALSDQKEVSIPEIYKRAGKELDLTKVHTQRSKHHNEEGATAYPGRKEGLEKDYALFMVSKKVAGIKGFFFEPNIGFLFIPLKFKGNELEIQTFSFKGYEKDFKKIGELIRVINQLTIDQVSIEKDFEKNRVVVSDELYENIVNNLTFWGYLVQAIDTRKLRGALTALREAEKNKGKPSNVPRYTHYYIALLVSKKVPGGRLFSKEERLCLLLIPRMADQEGATIAIIECGNSHEDIPKIKMACKASGYQGIFNFMDWAAPKGVKLLE